MGYHKDRYIYQQQYFGSFMITYDSYQQLNGMPNNISGNDLLLIFLFLINNIEKVKNSRLVKKFKGSAKKCRLFLSQ